jgi:hypothetical protein
LSLVNKAVIMGFSTILLPISQHTWIGDFWKGGEAGCWGPGAPAAGGPRGVSTPHTSTVQGMLCSGSSGGSLVVVSCPYCSLLPYSPLHSLASCLDHSYCPFLPGPCRREFNRPRRVQEEWRKQPPSSLSIHVCRWDWTFFQLELRFILLFSLWGSSLPARSNWNYFPRALP